MADPFASTTETGFALSPEARDVANRELNFFEQYLQPSSKAEQGRLLNILGTPRASLGETPTGQTLLRSMDLPVAAMERAATDSDIHPETLASHIDTLRHAAPHLLDLLHQIAQHHAGQTRSLVDPRYGDFLKPIQTSTTTPGVGNQILSGVGTALQLTSLLHNLGLFGGGASEGVSAASAAGLAGEGALFASTLGGLAGEGVSAASAAGLAGEGALFASIL